MLFFVIGDSQRLATLVADVLWSHYTTFNKLFKSSTLSLFAHYMYEAGLITADLCDNPVYDSIMEEFVTVMELNDEKEDVENDCIKFLGALKTLGGPLKVLSKKIEKEWRERASRELGITLNLS